MIIDTSAVVAILAGELERERFLAALGAADACRMSAASLLETGIVLDSRANPALARGADQLIGIFGVQIVPVDEQQARIARQAYRDYGRGSGHLAQLNFGDCFSYACAITYDEALLFKGDGFTHTDVRRWHP